MRHFQFFKPFSFLMVFLIFSGNSKIALSGDEIRDEIPIRYGLATVLGKTFDPVNDICFGQLSGFVMWDYDKVWRHWAPDPLRFKVEGTAGITASSEKHAMISVGMMALYYLEFISNSRILPFMEGGIGVIYTDFKVEGQGLHFNFNSQIGIGTEFKVNSGMPFFTSIRLSHISNAGLHHENRGINSFVVRIGCFF